MKRNYLYDQPTNVKDLTPIRRCHINDLLSNIAHSEMQQAEHWAIKDLREREEDLKTMVAWETLSQRTLKFYRLNFGMSKADVYLAVNDAVSLGFLVADTCINLEITELGRRYLKTVDPEAEWNKHDYSKGDIPEQTSSI